ncbi:hypothetical protein UNH65_09615 [Chitinophaga sp. 180180018-2]|nr:hypothetical protein [Chitinophaga sp. 212800010-3]
MITTMRWPSKEHLIDDLINWTFKVINATNIVIVNIITGNTLLSYNKILAICFSNSKQLN